MSYLDQIQTRAADTEKAKAEAFGTLTTNLLAEARGKKLSADQIAANDEALATLGYSLDQAIAIAAELRDLVAQEKTLVSETTLDSNLRDARAAIESHRAKAKEIIDQLDAELERLNNSETACIAQMAGMENARARYTPLAEKYWQAIGAGDPQQLAQRRHLISGLKHTAPDDGIQTIELEHLMNTPTDLAGEALLDSSIEFVPITGQSAKQLAALLETARRVVTWAKAYNHARTIRNNLRAYYLCTDPAGLPDVPRYQNAFIHADTVELNIRERDADQSRLLLQAPNESKDQFEKAMAKLRRERDKERRRLSIEIEGEETADELDTVNA